MNFVTFSAESAVKAIQGWEGPFISLYLPYGITGINADQMRIERKNTLEAAKVKLNHQDDAALAATLSDIIKLQDDPPWKNEHGTLIELPRTEAYIYSRDHGIRVILPAAIRAHFSFANFAEIEPLVYTTWMNEPYFILRLDLENPGIYQGCGNHLEEIPFKAPTSVKQNFGEKTDDFSLSTLIEVGDRNNQPKTDMNREGRATPFHGLSSRQTSHRDKNIQFWLGQIDLLVEKTATDHSIPLFIMGTDDLARLYQDTSERKRLFSVPNLPGVHSPNLSEVASDALKILLEHKQQSAKQELLRNIAETNLNDVLEMADSGRLRKLFVQQNDWFEHNNGSNEYEFTNTRALVLAKALKKGVEVRFTKTNIDNTHSIAGLSYE